MNTNVIITAIADIGMANLASFLGSDRLDRLSELGIKMTPRNIARAAFQEQGFDLFRNLNLRQGVLNAFSQEQLSAVYGPSAIPHDPIELSKFRWAENSATERFLSIFGVALSEVFGERSEDFAFKVVTQIDKPLFDYQNSIRRQLNTFTDDQGMRRIVAHMPTGAGKTRTTMELVSDFFRKRNASDPTLVVWMAHSDELCEQAVQTFLSIWSKLGSEDASVYRMWGGRRGVPIDFEKPSFVVTSFQSCHSAIISPNDSRFESMALLRSECDLLIVDEAHMSTAATYSCAIDYLCNEQTKLIGLTATPGRHHIGGDVSETQELAEFYQNNKITLGKDVTNGSNPIEFLQGRGILSVVDRVRLDSGVDVALSGRSISAISDLLDIPKEVLTKLGENAQRTSRIAATALMLAVEQGKQTIVFCPTKENATDLSLLLQERGCSARAITGETPMQERRKWIEDFKSGGIQVLSNFGVLTTGFDAPNIEAVIIARPTTSVVLYSQMVGRGLRGSFVGGTERCTLVDVVDNIQNMPEIPQAFTFFDEHFGAI